MLCAGTQEIEELQASILRSLASPRRVRLIHLLMERPHEVRDIAVSLKLSQAATSQHLAALRAVGLVEATRDGRNVSYRLADPDIATACRLLREVLVRRLARLGHLAAAAAAGDAATTSPGSRLEVARP